MRPRLHLRALVLVVALPSALALVGASAACNDDGGGGSDTDDSVPDIGGNEPIVSGGGPNLGGFGYGGADGQGGFPVPGLGGMGGMF